MGGQTRKQLITVEQFRELARPTSTHLDVDEVNAYIRECQEETKVQKYTSGIRKALAYFTYARLFRADGTIISRAGGMRHRDDYSDHVQDVSSNKQYNDILDMAERYLSDALEYLKHFTPEGEVKQQRGTRAHIHVIGN